MVQFRKETYRKFSNIAGNVLKLKARKWNNNNTVIGKSKLTGFTNFGRNIISMRERNLAMICFLGWLGILLSLNRYTGAPWEGGSYPVAARWDGSYPGHREEVEAIRGHRKKVAAIQGHREKVAGMRGNLKRWQLSGDTVRRWQLSRDTVRRWQVCGATWGGGSYPETTWNDSCVGHRG
jgi:hypothetical protein